MLEFSTGDRVSVLKDTIKGIVVEVSGSKIKIKDQDGFIRNYRSNQLVHLESHGSYNLQENLQTKEIIKQVIKTSKSAGETEILEIDLHIERLTNSHSELTNHEIIQRQMAACRAFVQNAISAGQKRIIIIHGKGEGILKTEIHYYLSGLGNRQSVNLDFHEADYHEYGMGGATEVLIY